MIKFHFLNMVSPSVAKIFKLRYYFAFSYNFLYRELSRAQRAKMHYTQVDFKTTRVFLKPYSIHTHAFLTAVHIWPHNRVGGGPSQMMMLDDEGEREWWHIRFSSVFLIMDRQPYGCYLHDHRSKVVKLGSGWFCRQKFSHYLPLKSKTAVYASGERTNPFWGLWVWVWLDGIIWNGPE